MDVHAWYGGHVTNLVGCPACIDELRALYPDVAECFPESLCYLPSQAVKLMFVAEAPGLDDKNNTGLQKNRQSALDWMKLDTQWNYLAGPTTNFKSDSYGSFISHIIQGMKKAGLELKPHEIAVTNCIKYPLPQACRRDLGKKLTIASTHQASHLTEEFLFCHPTIAVALGSTAIKTVAKLNNAKEISYDHLIKLPHPSGSHPAGRWHYAAYDLFDPLVHHFIKLLS